MRDVEDEADDVFSGGEQHMSETEDDELSIIPTHDDAGGGAPGHDVHSGSESNDRVVDGLGSSSSEAPIDNHRDRPSAIEGETGKRTTDRKKPRKKPRRTHRTENIVQTDIADDIFDDEDMIPIRHGNNV